MTETLQIFISGTQDDLQPERQAVAETIRALGHTPLMAETYGAQPMPSYDAIREMIARADIYLGVYGARYGSLKMESGVSVTEFEFTEFRRTRPSRILVYVKDCTPEDEQAAFLGRVQDFKAGYFRRPRFTNPAQLAEWVKEDLAQLIARVVHEKLRGAPDPLLIQEYLAQVAANKPYVLWDDQTYIDRTVKPQDEEIFYPRLAARYDPRAPERDAKPEPLDAVLAREKKLVLLGEPGIGKTTALLHLAWETAQRAMTAAQLPIFDCRLPIADHITNRKSKIENPFIPIYIELKYYEGGELETLLARRINDMLRPANLMLDADATHSTRILKQWLAQSDMRFLLLLDGLNEVRPEFQTALRGALEALLCTPHHIVISCRERDYDASLRDDAAAFVLQGLQGDEIRNYLQRALGDKGEKLFDVQIRWDEKMQTLAANPLMLWLISVVASQDPEARLPANRGKLFKAFVSQMPRLRRREVPANVPLDIVETALAKLGFEMLERGRLAADLGEVRGWQIPTASRDLDAVLAQAKDWRFLKSDGRFGEPIEFLHQLFQEYFAAIHLNFAIRNSQFATVLGDRPFKDEWHETIAMLAGICDQPAELVKWLGAQVVEKQQGSVAFLVQRCWETSDAAANDEARAAVVDARIAALRDPDADVRERAAYALGQIGDARAVEPLIAALRDPEAEVRWRAAYALRQISDAHAVEPLIAALRDPDWHVRERAAGALEQIGDARAVEPLIAALRDPDADVRESAADALGEIGAPAVEPLIAALRDPDAEVRGSAAYALGKIGDVRAVEPLIAALRDPDADMRERAADALGKIKDAHAVELLIAALRDPDKDVRWGAADALGKIGDARALPELERIAREDTGETVWGSVADTAREAIARIRR
jgi:HEAT repeat protein